MGIVGDRIRKQVWRKTNGKCAYCGKPVDFKGPKGFQADHLTPTYWNWSDEECIANNVIRGSDDVSNLMPACRRCNKWKDKFNIDEFRALIVKQHEIQIVENNGYRLLVDFNIIQPVTWDGLFYFEKMPGFKTNAPRIVSTNK